jgi:predicted acyltransferase
LSINAVPAYTRYAQSILDKLPNNRLLSLDVFRGITITAMVLVNNPGSWSYVYAPLAHADWHGWTPTDLIFPFFIFIVGVSISLSIAVMQSKGLSKSDITQSAAIRMIKLILLGWFLALFFFNFTQTGYNWLEERLYSMRFMGVLQRIGIVYFCCVLGYLYLSKRLFYLLAPALLLIYTGLMWWMPYTDLQGNVYVGLLEKGNNLAAWLDSLLFNTKHLYARSATPFAYDPEGLLSTLPAIVSGISGVAVGDYIRHAKQHRFSLTKQIKQLSIAGCTLTLAGLAGDSIFPINKILWSPSYVLLSSGLAILALTSCTHWIEHHNCKTWTAPFIVFGTNSIGFFMVAGILGRLVNMIPAGDSSLKPYLFESFYQPMLGNYNGSLAWALTFLVVCYILFHLLYKRGIIWKV